jgi:hypothetical protein
MRTFLIVENYIIGGVVLLLVAELVLLRGDSILAKGASNLAFWMSVLLLVLGVEIGRRPDEH